MRVSPAFYGHLVTLLGGLASGKIVVCLEGGYFLPSLAEGAVMTVRALLGDPCGHIPPFINVHPVVIDVINNLKFVLKPFWKCFSTVNTFVYPKQAQTFADCVQIKENEHLVVVKYCGQPERPPYSTRCCYPLVNQLNNEVDSKIIEILRISMFETVSIRVFIY